MKKIPTLFKQGEGGKLLNEVRDELIDIFKDPNLRVTRKFDGTAIYYLDGQLYGRHCVRKGKETPDGFIGCTYDPITSKTFGWVAIESDVFQYKKPLREALKKIQLKENTTYELIGTKINNNNEKIDGHELVEHGVIDVASDLPPFLEIDKNIDNIKNFLEPYFKKMDYEGVVFWDKDKPIAKLKVKDFSRFD